MKKIGNIKHYLSDELIAYMIDNQGIAKPMWQVFNGENLPYKVDLPFTGNLKWWFSKLEIGNVFPMHVDTFEDTNNARYWIPCQDYVTGHVFIYGNKLISDYRAGDVFLFDDPTTLHGAANLAESTKISLQIAIPINNDQDGRYLFSS